MRLRIPARADFDFPARVTLHLDGWFGSAIRWIVLHTTQRQWLEMAKQDDAGYKKYMEYINQLHNRCQGCPDKDK